MLEESLFDLQVWLLCGSGDVTDGSEDLGGQDLYHECNKHKSWQEMG
jgi:hypothetical protein